MNVNDYVYPASAFAEEGGIPEVTGLHLVTEADEDPAVDPASSDEEDGSLVPANLLNLSSTRPTDDSDGTVTREGVELFAFLMKGCLTGNCQKTPVA